MAPTKPPPGPHGALGGPFHLFNHILSPYVEILDPPCLLRKRPLNLSLVNYINTPFTELHYMYNQMTVKAYGHLVQIKTPNELLYQYDLHL